MSYFCNTDKEASELNTKELFKIKVCNGWDNLSYISYKVLNKEHKHLPFFNKINKRFMPKDCGTIIRWLYRGLTLEQAIKKVNNSIKVRTYCITKALEKR